MMSSPKLENVWVYLNSLCSTVLSLFWAPSEVHWWIWALLYLKKTLISLPRFVMPLLSRYWSKPQDVANPGKLQSNMEFKRHSGCNLLRGYSKGRCNGMLLRHTTLRWRTCTITVFGNFTKPYNVRLATTRLPTCTPYILTSDLERDSWCTFWV